MAGYNDELNELVHRITESEFFSQAPHRVGLLKFFWEHRDEYLLPHSLWDEVLYDLSESKKKDAADFDTDTSVRNSCLDLRKHLAKYFAKVPQGWHIDLPKAKRNQGYRLRITELGTNPTMRLWKAHLQPGRRVAVVYTEQLFFQDWPKHLIFRYYHINADREKQALAELQAEHPEMHNGGLNIAFPYVSSGEIDARDLIGDWFADNAHVKIQKAVTRIMNYTEVSKSSLILFRSPTTNRMVADILERPKSRHLAFSMHERGITANERRYGRVIVKKPTEEELNRFAPYTPQRFAEGCQIDFSPEKGTVLAILSRVRSPWIDAAVTVLNTDFGRAVEQLADVLTNDDKLGEILKHVEWGTTLPDSFEILFAISIGPLAMAHLHGGLEVLAWRSY